MNKFGFLIYPTNINALKNMLIKFDFLLNRVSEYKIKTVFRKLPPWNYIKVKGIKSITGKEIEGMFVLCPLLPEHFASLDKNYVLRKLTRSVKIAEKNGAKIIGLAGFTSIFSNQGEDLVGKLRVSVTTGNTYTAFLVIEGIKKALSVLDRKLSESTIAIIGASGDIGGICVKYFALKAKKILLAARDQKKLKDFVDVLQGDMRTNIELINDVAAAVSLADVVLTATSSVSPILNFKDFKSGTIVCDVSVPANVAREIINVRNDIFIFEGGYASLPNIDNIRNRVFKQHFPHGIIFGCLAETMLLTFEEKFENFSLGRGKITLENVTKIGEMADKHGFQLAPFFCGEKIINSGDIQRLKTIVNHIKNK